MSAGPQSVRSKASGLAAQLPSKSMRDLMIALKPLRAPLGGRGVAQQFDEDLEPVDLASSAIEDDVGLFTAGFFDVVAVEAANGRRPKIGNSPRRCSTLHLLIDTPL